MRASGALLKDYLLTTAEILYHLPDFPVVLQSFIWQQIDSGPDFPALRRFLEFWERNIDGRLHSVRICNTRLLHPAEMRFADCELRLH
ncbi:MAG: usg protein [Alphaproteobacteria bacterium]